MSEKQFVAEFLTPAEKIFSQWEWPAPEIILEGVKVTQGVFSVKPSFYMARILHHIIINGKTYYFGMNAYVKIQFPNGDALYLGNDHQMDYAYWHDFYGDSIPDIIAEGGKVLYYFDFHLDDFYPLKLPPQTNDIQEQIEYGITNLKCNNLLWVLKERGLIKERVWINPAHFVAPDVREGVGTVDMDIFGGNSSFSYEEVVIEWNRYMSAVVENLQHHNLVMVSTSASRPDEDKMHPYEAYVNQRASVEMAAELIQRLVKAKNEVLSGAEAEDKPGTTPYSLNSFAFVFLVFLLKSLIVLLAPMVDITGIVAGMHCIVDISSGLNEYSASLFYSAGLAMVGLTIFNNNWEWAQRIASDPDFREQVVQDLIKNPAQLGLLKGMLNSKDDEARERAIQIYIEVGRVNPKSIDFLSWDLGAPSPLGEAVEEIFYAVKKENRRTLGPVFAALGSRNPNTVEAGKRILMRIGETYSDFTGPLIAGLRDNNIEKADACRDVLIGMAARYHNVRISVGGCLRDSDGQVAKYGQEILRAADAMRREKKSAPTQEKQENAPTQEKQEETDTEEVGIYSDIEAYLRNTFRTLLVFYLNEETKRFYDMQVEDRVRDIFQLNPADRPVIIEQMLAFQLDDEDMLYVLDCLPSKTEKEIQAGLQGVEADLMGRLIDEGIGQLINLLGPQTAIRALDMVGERLAEIEREEEQLELIRNRTGKSIDEIDTLEEGINLYLERQWEEGIEENFQERITVLVNEGRLREVNPSLLLEWSGNPRLLFIREAIEAELSRTASSRAIVLVREEPLRPSLRQLWPSAVMRFEPAKLIPAVPLLNLPASWRKKDEGAILLLEMPLEERKRREAESSYRQARRALLGGELREAKSGFERVLSIDPEHRDAQRGLRVNEEEIWQAEFEELIDGLIVAEEELPRAQRILNREENRSKDRRDAQKIKAARNRIEELSSLITERKEAIARTCQENLSRVQHYAKRKEQRGEIERQKTVGMFLAEIMEAKNKRVRDELQQKTAEVSSLLEEIIRCREELKRLQRRIRSIRQDINRQRSRGSSGRASAIARLNEELANIESEIQKLRETEEAAWKVFEREPLFVFTFFINRMRACMRGQEKLTDEVIEVLEEAFQRLDTSGGDSGLPDASFAVVAYTTLAGGNISKIIPIYLEKEREYLINIRLRAKENLAAFIGLTCAVYYRNENLLFDNLWEVIKAHLLQSFSNTRDVLEAALEQDTEVAMELFYRMLTEIDNFLYRALTARPRPEDETEDTDFSIDGFFLADYFLRIAIYLPVLKQDENRTERIQGLDPLGSLISRTMGETIDLEAKRVVFSPELFNIERFLKHIFRPGTSSEMELLMQIQQRLNTFSYEDADALRKALELEFLSNFLPEEDDGLLRQERRILRDRVNNFVEAIKRNGRYEPKTDLSPMDVVMVGKIQDFIQIQGLLNRDAMDGILESLVYLSWNNIRDIFSQVIIPFATTGSFVFRDRRYTVIPTRRQEALQIATDSLVKAYVSRDNVQLMMLQPFFRQYLREIYRRSGDESKGIVRTGIEKVGGDTSSILETEVRRITFHVPLPESIASISRRLPAPHGSNCFFLYVAGGGANISGVAGVCPIEFFIQPEVLTLFFVAAGLGLLAWWLIRVFREGKIVFRPRYTVESLRKQVRKLAELYASPVIEGDTIEKLVKEIEEIEEKLGIKSPQDYFAVSYRGYTFNIHPYRIPLPGRVEPVSLDIGIDILGKMIEERRARVIYITGRPGSGKSYLAEEISRRGVAGIPPKQIKIIGLDLLRGDMAITVITKKFAELGCALVIIEGVNPLELFFAQESDLRKPDILVFTEVDEKVRWQRIIERPTHDFRLVTLIPMSRLDNIQDRYFGVDLRRREADIIINTAFSSPLLQDSQDDTVQPQ